MGQVTGTRVLNDGKILYEIVLSKEESLQLQGNTENIIVFSEDTIEIPSRISLRGKNDATKYFLIPKELREDIKRSRDVTCQRINSKFKSVYIYVIDKLRL